MYLHIVEPKTAQQFVARTTEPERMMIRSANPDRLEYLRQNDFSSDGPLTPESMVEAQAIIRTNFTKASEGVWWEKQTWNW
jgi:hypothetical protein